MTNGHDAAFGRGGFLITPDDYDLGAEGMSKREYFAAMALRAVAANKVRGMGYENDPAYTGHETRLVTSAKLQAEAAVRMADALIEALNADTEETP